MPACSRTSKRVVTPPPFSRRNNPREEAHPAQERGFDAETGKRNLTSLRFYLSSLPHYSSLYHAFALCPASESQSEPPVGRPSPEPTPAPAPGLQPESPYGSIVRTGSKDIDQSTSSTSSNPPSTLLSLLSYFRLSSQKKKQLTSAFHHPINHV